MAPQGDEEGYDRLKALQEFDDSKGGVKALVDSGLTTIPSYFVQPPDILRDISTTIRSDVDGINIPTIDLTCADRPTLVDRVAKAARDFGFFQVVNHGIHVDVMNRLIGAIKEFHQQPVEAKARYYGMDMGRDVAFFSNLDLFQSKAASWRDAIRVKMGSTPPKLDEIPEICRSEIVQWDQQIKQVGDLLMEILSEGLEGVSVGRLKELNCSKTRDMVAHYYPYCPEPNRTIGIVPHTDAGVITILLQDHVGGLQVKHNGKWLSVDPVPGALVINIGDMLQIMSNDEYKSVEHRVIANSSHEPRISIAVFFHLDEGEKICGPLPELISHANPAVYRQFPLNEYLTKFFTQELDGKSLRNYFKVEEEKK